MKLNRKRKDARFPNWILDLLSTLQIKYQWTFTEALIRCAEKGAAYYNKQWLKMHPKERTSEEAQENDERCPNDRQDDYKQNEPQEKVSDEEVEEMLDSIYGKDRKK